MGNTPTCFISYSWDSDTHKTWVRHLAERLQSSGVHTLLDQWDLKPGSDVLSYMEQAIASANFVALVCTPTFGRKANSREGGVGYEQAIVTAELFADHETPKFVPVLRRGPAVDSLPLYLQSRIYIDFTDDSQLERSLEDLLRVLHGSPAFTRPPLGTAPKFALKSAKAANRATTPLEPATVAQFKQLVEFAFGTAGLNMGTKADAAEWAQQWLENHAIDDLGPFVDVIEAITSRGAYAISDSQRTAKLAERFLSDHGADALVPFREYMDYAYSGDGLNLPTRVAAAEWALTQLDKHRSA